MKTLIVIRHAKSSWEDFSQKDFDRPLNERGKKDAPEMAKRLQEKGLKIDLLVSSPAKRAQKTARLFASEYNMQKEEIMLVDELYEPTQEAFEKTVALLPDNKDTVALFSHNPGITSFVNTLSNVRIDDMPTCGAFAVSTNIKNWKEFKEGEKKFLFFDYPKNPLG